MSRRLHWGIGIAIVYGLFAGSTIGFVVFAMSQQVDLVSPDYYPQSLAHDARIAATARAAALGDTFAVDVDESASAIRIRWPGSMRVESGSVTLYRASDAGADRHVAVAPDGGNRQSLPFGAADRGAWTVRVNWTAGGTSFFAERRLMLP